MLESFGGIVMAGVVITFVLVGIIVAKLYTRSSQERAFVRTGLGGMKVVMSGGALVLPVFHELMWVNQNTLKLDVKRNENDSLNTQDRLRVDVIAEFYVRVKKTEEAIATAAQTLGIRTMNPEGLKQLVEGKLVDALRAASLSMPMEDLFNKRPDFIQKVRSAVADDLDKNGLELESVSVTRLDQTSIEFFNKDNALDAAGLLILTTSVQTSARDRNAIEQDRLVEIETKNLEANRKKLDISKDNEAAKLNTALEIATLSANQKAAVAETENKNRILQENAVLEADRTINETRIETKRKVDTATIEAETAVKVKVSETDITVFKKQAEVAESESKTNEAKALTIRSEEKIETARQVEVADRKKAVTLVSAEEKAQEKSIEIVVAAEAEAKSASSIAEAIRVKAEGERNASLLDAEGIRAIGEATADALAKKLAADNTTSEAIIALQTKLAMIAALPTIIAQSVKPLENIDSIRIAEVGGLNGGNGNNGASVNGGGAGGNGNGGLGNEIMTAALRYRINQPVVDALLGEVGLKTGGDMNALVSSAAQAAGIVLDNAADSVTIEHAHDHAASAATVEAHAETKVELEVPAAVTVENAEKGGKSKK